MLDIFTTAVLARVVELLPPPSTFLLDTFFPGVQTGDTEEIYFDIDTSKPRIAPFVHPTVAGKVVADRGFQTNSFKPAYVKDKRILLPGAPIKRRPGERIGGSLDADAAPPGAGRAEPAGPARHADPPRGRDGRGGACALARSP